MKTLLPLLKDLSKKNIRSFFGAFLILLLVVLSTRGQAQVYYLTSDANANTLATTDALNMMNYNGSGNTVIKPSLTNSPIKMVEDLANGRLFVYEGLAAQKSIKVVTASTGVVTAVISVPYNVSAMEYDAASDYIYFLTTSGSIALTVADALYKVKPSETTPTLIASSITTSPLNLALDIPNNRVFIYESVPANRGIKTFDLTTNTITATAVINAGTVVDIAYDTPTGYIYYLTNDGSPTVTSATDALNKILPGGAANSTVVIKASVTGSPSQCLLLDAGNNRAYIYEGLTANRAIKTVDLTTGNVTTVLSLSSQATGVTVTAMVAAGVPTVTTASASGITATGASLGGNVTRTDATVTERGVVYSSTNTTPTTNDSKATNGNGTGSFSANITGLNGVTTYYVRAYAVSVAGTGYGPVSSFSTTSNDATLSGFTISSGTLTPAFAAGTVTYTASVANTINSVTVTPTRNQANASIKVNGTSVTSGSASGNISLSVGNTTITIIVTAQDGTTTKTYTTTVNRAKAPQTITFASTNSKTYGDADYLPGGSASSGLSVSYSSDNPSVATIISGHIHIVSAGTANITASQAGDANTAAANSVVQALTVNKATQSISFNSLSSKTYGDADFAPGASASSGLAIIYSSDNSAVATIISNQVHIVGKGTVNVTASQAGDANRLAASNVTQNLTVNTKTLTVTANAQTKIYGDNDPALTYTTAGTVGGDIAAGALTRATGNNAGIYAINQGTLSYSSNYTVTFVGANLTVSKRPLTIAPQPVTKVYGTADFANGAPYALNGTSLAPGDGIGGTFGRDNSAENVGVYALTLGTQHPVSSVGDDLSANYTITLITNTFTITAKPITVTASAATKSYDDADPAFTYGSSGLAFSDTFTGALTRDAGENAGSYAIRLGSLSAGTNYTISYTGNNLTIGQKTINITADAKTKTYGDADPALTYTADALASGDSFTGAISRVSGQDAGNYAIGQGNLALNGNYTLNFTGANFTIDKKTVTVTAIANNKTYGDTDPELSYTSSALASGDSFSGNVARLAGETAGTYLIGQGSLAVSNPTNYTLYYIPADFTIGKRIIDVYTTSADSQYGNPDNGVSYYYTGTLTPGDGFTGLPGHTPGTAVGSYPTTINTLAISNPESYTLNFHSSLYNIIQREIIVSSGTGSKLYGDADPDLTYNIYSGTLIDGATITGALIRDPGETAGLYAVRQGTLTITDPNFKLTYQGGNFEIQRAPLSITIFNKSRVALKPNPVFTYTLTGFKNGDTEATAFTTPIHLTTDANISSPPGDYSIYNSANSQTPNYDFLTFGGTLVVTPASSINTLASVTVDGGVFAPSFDPATDFYQVTVPNGTTSTTLTPTLSDQRATITIGYDPASGTPVASGTPYTVTLAQGNGVQVPVNVTAEDGTVQSYYFNINPVPSDSKLSNLVTSAGVLTPSFDPNVTSYTVDVSADTDSLTITPTTNDPLATARVSGGGEHGGTGAKRIAVNEGGNPNSVVVKSADNTSSTVYQLYIKRPIRLKTLTLSAGILYPAFDPNVTTYTVKVPQGTPSITLTPTGNQSYYQITVNGDNVNYGDSSVPIFVDDNNPTTALVQITAGDGETTKIYTFNIMHAQAAGSITFAAIPAKTYDDGSFMLTATGGGSSAPITYSSSNAAVATISGVIVTITGVGATNITANQAGDASYDAATPVTRTLTVNAAPATVSIAFDPLPAVTYGAADITPVASSANANPITYASSNVSVATIINGKIHITGVGSTVITASQAATDANHQAPAEVSQTLIVKPLTISTLATLTISAGSLSPAFSSGTTSYNIAVTNAITGIAITPTASDATESIKVNGTTVNSGSASALIPLAAGINTINTVVTAQDGNSKTYTVMVSRPASLNTGINDLRLSTGYLTRMGNTDTLTSTLGVSSNNVSVFVTPVNANSTIKVNGQSTSANMFSSPIALGSGVTSIPVEITAEDGITKRILTLRITRTGSVNTGVTNLRLSTGYLTRMGNTDTLTSTLGVSSNNVSVFVTPVNANSTIKVNGQSTSANMFSSPIALGSGVTSIPVEITAEDGITKRILTLRITRTGSVNTGVTNLRLSTGYLTRMGNTDTLTSTLGVSSNNVSVFVTPLNANSTIEVNGQPTSANMFSSPIALVSGVNSIPVKITAEDGVTSRTLTLNITRTAQPIISAVKTTRSNIDVLQRNPATNQPTPQEIIVHQAVSPNGDGINDRFTIDGITDYPENTVSIMNRNGDVIYTAKGYDNYSNAFDGHASNGALQQAGTYFYSVEYKKGEETKRKTGYIVIKY